MRRRVSPVLIAARMFTIAADLGNVFGFLAVLAAIVTVLSTARHSALAGGMRAFTGSGHTAS